MVPCDLKDNKNFINDFLSGGILFIKLPQGVSACMHAQSLSHVRLCDPMDSSPPGSSVNGILQPEYWSGLPVPSPGDLPDPEVKPASPALKADSLLSEPPSLVVQQLRLSFFYKGHRFKPGQGTKIPHATWQGQKKERY